MPWRALGCLIFAAQAWWALSGPAAGADHESPAVATPLQRQVIAIVPKHWPPQYDLDINGNPVGFAIDVMDEIAARAGVTVIYRVAENFAAVEAAMAAGNGDIIPNSGITPKRAQAYSFTAPVQAVTIAIFVRSNTVGIGGLGDLAGRHVGIVETSVGEDVTAAHESITKVMFKDAASALFGLLSGRVDALIHARSVIVALALRAGIEDRITTVGEPVLEIKRAIRVRKDRPEILAALDAAVRSFVDTSDYRRIYAKWYGKPTPDWTGKRVAVVMAALATGLLIFFALFRYRLLIRVNRRIAASEEQFRDLVEGAVPGVLIHRHHRPLFVNRSYARIFGYDGPDEIMRQSSVLDHVAPHERERLKTYTAARLRGEEVSEVYEFEGVRKDGAQIWLENRGRVVDWEGSPAIQRTVVDVTEKRRVETELMLRSSQQAVVAELGQRALIDDDLASFMNLAVQLVAKFTQSDLCGLLEIEPDGDAFLMRAGVGWKAGVVGHATVSAGPDSQAGFTLSSKEPVVVADWNAETRFAKPPLLRDHGVACGMTVVIGDPGRPVGVLGVHRKSPKPYSDDDMLFLKTVAVMLASAISRQRADDAVRASEGRLRGAIESLQEGFALYDADDRLVTVNDVYRRISPRANEFLVQNARFEEIVRCNVAQGWIVEARGREEEFIRERLERHRDPKDTIVRQHSDGRWYMIKETRTPERGTAVTFSDITELKRVETALRDSREQLRAVIDNSPSAVTLKDTDGRYLLVNRTFASWLAARPEDIVGNTPADLKLEHAESIRNGDQLVLRTGEVNTFELSARYPDGKARDLLISKGPVRAADGVIVAVCTIVTDIGKRKEEQKRLAEMQAELAHVSRISAMGEMAAGLAHELNQPLTAITNYAKGTLRRLHAGGGETVDLLPIMELVAEQALRAGEIIREIRRFMNRSEPHKSPIDLRRTIYEVMALLAGEINMSGVDVAVEVPSSLPPVMADPIQIQQVLLNLIRNAVSAMNGRGDGHHRLEVGATANGNRDVEIYVKDNGPGIPPDAKERLFEPFFTTKTDGLGMGLSISRSIVTGHHGRIWASSEKGEGATFRFTLPTGTDEAHDDA